MSVWVLSSFETGDAGFQFVSKHPWIKPWGISWHMGVDGISLFLVVLTGVLFPLVIFGTDPHHDTKRYLAWMLLLEAGMMGSFLSLDLFLFFVFFEIVLVPMYFLIGGWGYEDRVYAATKFFLYTMVGSAFMLVGVVATSVLARTQRRRRRITFDLVEIAENAELRRVDRSMAVLRVRRSRSPSRCRCSRCTRGCPDAHTQAPTGGSVILAGVMLKLGTYGLLRFGVYLFPEAARWAHAAVPHARRRSGSSTARSRRRCRRT